MTRTVNHQDFMCKGVLVLVLIASFLLVWYFQIPHVTRSSFEVTDVIQNTRDGPLYEESFASKEQTGKAHAASTFARNGQLVAFWYGGSEEGADDVQIYRAIFKAGSWSNATAELSPPLVMRDLARFVRKVGNPVGFHRTDGRTWLFFVSVSVGGWAGSSINLVESDDQGQSWGKVKKLVTSPFLNLSTLVRNPPFYFHDGTIGLPVYHEFLGKFGEILRLDSDARVIDKIRLSDGAHSLQPVIVPTTDSHATGLMRYAGEPPMRLLEFETTDGGNTWSQPTRSNIANPNAAITAVHIGDNRILAVVNNSTMGISDTQKGWQVFHQLEFEDVSPVSHDYEYSYPTLTRDRNGIFDLLYSWNHQSIKHIRFNDAWLRGKIAAAGENR
jgi:predicted neuraminidase